MKRQFELFTPDSETSIEIDWSLCFNFSKRNKYRTPQTISDSNGT